MQCYINTELYINALSIYKNNMDLVNTISNGLAIKCCINMNDFEMGQQIIENINNNSIDFINILKGLNRIQNV